MFQRFTDGKEKLLLADRARREKARTAAAADRPPLAAELGRVNAELDRMRALLREHGIEPSDPS